MITDFGGFSVLLNFVVCLLQDIVSNLQEANRVRNLKIFVSLLFVQLRWEI